MLFGAHGFEFLEVLLGRWNCVLWVCARSCGNWTAGEVASAWVVGARAVVWLRVGVLRNGLDAVDRLSWLGHGKGGSGKEEFARGSIGGCADEQVVEAESGEELREHLRWAARPVNAENAVVARGSLNLHACLRGDGLKDLKQRGVVGVDGQPAFAERNGGRGGRLIRQ